MTKKPAISIRANPNGDWPQVDPTAYIDPTAQIIGNMHIGHEVFVGPNAVIRADESDDKGQVQPIEIGAECNIQDGVIVHRSPWKNSKIEFPETDEKLLLAIGTKNLLEHLFFSNIQLHW